MTDPMVSRLARAAWTATLAAGAVGVVRQRLEAGRVRRGEIPPDGPDGSRPPLRPHAAPLARLAGWVPGPPRTTVGRAAASAWAAPLTLVGLAVALASGARPRWDPARRCLVATGVGGASAAALRVVGAGANTIGQVVLCRSDAPSPALLDHESVHVRQAERLGPLLVPAYLWLNAIHGYRDNPLEHAARLGARRSPAAATPSTTRSEPPRADAGADVER
jgi:hypothetical protein